MYVSQSHEKSKMLNAVSNYLRPFFHRTFFSNNVQSDKETRNAIVGFRFFFPIFSPFVDLAYCGLDYEIVDACRGKHWFLTERA